MAAADGADERPAVIDRELRLRGHTVVLRPPVEADAEALGDAVGESVAELAPWMTWCHEAYGAEEALDWVLATSQARADGRECSFVVTDERHGTVLGACGLNEVDAAHRRANLGYWVRTAATGRGVATEAAGLVARFGMTVLGLIRVEIVVGRGNVASRRVAEKIGATFEGILRNRFWVRGEPVDAMLYSLVPSDLTDGPDGRREPR